MNIDTICGLARKKKYPEAMLRRMLKENRLPGFYSASRYYVNVDMLEAQLSAECTANANGNTEITQARQG